MLETPITSRQPDVDPETHLRSIAFGGGKQAYFERVANDPKWVGVSHDEIALEAIKQAKQDAEGREETTTDIDENVAAHHLLRTIVEKNKNGHEAE